MDRALWQQCHRTDRLELRRGLLEADVEKQFWRDEIEGDGKLIFEFELAEQMGCTVAELRTRLSEAEFQQWRAFKTYSLRKQVEAHEKAIEAAKEGG